MENSHESTCTSNKKKIHCWCFPMNFAKFLRTLFYRTPPDICYWIFFHSLSCFFATRLTNRNQDFSILEHVLSGLSNVMNIMNFAFTLLCKTDDPVVATGKQLLLQAFLWDRRDRSSCICDSLIQRCSLNKLFLNTLQY